MPGGFSTPQSRTFRSLIGELIKDNSEKMTRHQDNGSGQLRTPSRPYVGGNFEQGSYVGVVTS